MTIKSLRIGTRGSPLAMAQAGWVRERLLSYDEKRQLEIVPIKTSGDLHPQQPLFQLGGKEAFTRELEKALLAGEIDLAVHSMKDLPVVLPAGLMLAAITARENPLDVFISRTGADLESLPDGAAVATGSLRRRAQLLRYRSDLVIRDIRGNVDTRLKKLHDGFADGLVLAAAALHRLGRGDRIAQYLHPDICIPAAGQGALGIEIREDNRPLKELLAMLHDQESGLTVRAERCFLHALGAGCHTPAGAYAELIGGDMHLRGFVSSPDGKEMVRMKMLGRREEGKTLGDLLARRVLNGGGSSLLVEKRGEL
jgi:hydroxymethylbilane synthase